MMKTTMRAVVILASLLVLGGCDDPKGPAYVKGSMSVFPGNSADMVEGELTRSSGSDYYGYCKMKDGKFNFTVADAPLAELSAGNNLYMSVQGIEGAGEGGAPIQGLLNENGDIKDGEEFVSTFSTAQLGAYSSDTFNLSPADGDCKVELLAEPALGELVPERNREFEYYVRINCRAMSNVTGVSTGVKLQSFYAEFYFDNC